MTSSATAPARGLAVEVLAGLVDEFSHPFEKVVRHDRDRQDVFDPDLRLLREQRVDERTMLHTYGNDERGGELVVLEGDISEGRRVVECVEALRQQHFAVGGWEEVRV